MMTRSKKKRTAGKDISCPKKSNQKYSAVPGDEAVEIGEMVTMEHGGTSGGMDADCQRTEYRQVAWLLREKLNDLVDGDEGEFPESELRSLLDMAASRNIVCVDPKVLNPVLWRTLPKEVLLLVLARLPLPDITRLRSLSREWRRDMATVNSDINQACDEASSTMVALLSPTSTDAFFVSIYDITKCSWQCAYHLRLRRPWSDDLEEWPHTWTPVDAGDGGLMCFVSLWIPKKRSRLSIVVVNLLTRVQHELPPLHYRYYTVPAMVQIKVDSHTKCYNVVVVAYGPSNRAIETYNSGTRQWTRAVPPSGCIFGPVHNWTSANGWCYKMSSSTPGAYDFGERKLELCTDFDLSERGSMTEESTCDSLLIDTALQKDGRIFALQEEAEMDTSLQRRMHKSFCITEYHLDIRTKAAEKGKSYECSSFEDLIEEELSSMQLYACDGFLMVVFHYDQRSECFRLLDLSTGEWSNVPQNPSSEGSHTPESVLCRAFWNVIP